MHLSYCSQVKDATESVWKGSRSFRSSHYFRQFKRENYNYILIVASLKCQPKKKALLLCRLVYSLGFICPGFDTSASTLVKWKWVEFCIGQLLLKSALKLKSNSSYSTKIRMQTQVVTAQHLHTQRFSGQRFSKRWCERRIRCLSADVKQSEVF